MFKALITVQSPTVVKDAEVRTKIIKKIEHNNTKGNSGRLPNNAKSEA